MTTEDKARFLDACPELLDDVQTIDQTLGREPLRDWNAAWERIADMVHERKAKWKKAEEKRFRDVFTQQDPGAEPVLKDGLDGGYEPDADLRDFDNVPLEEIDADLKKAEDEIMRLLREVTE